MYQYKTYQNILPDISISLVLYTQNLNPGYGPDYNSSYLIFEFYDVHDVPNIVNM